MRKHHSASGGRVHASWMSVLIHQWEGAIQDPWAEGCLAPGAAEMAADPQAPDTMNVRPPPPQPRVGGSGFPSFQRAALVLVVLLIAGGLFMFTYKSTQFNVEGFALVLGASFIGGIRWTLTQMLLQKAELGE